MKFIVSGIVDYSVSMIDMDIAHEMVSNGEDEIVFITEHPPLYSAGKSFESSDFIKIPHAKIYYPGRGGRIVVHSPGQVVVYPIINLRKRNINISTFVYTLEQWMIDVLKKFNINATRSKKGVGVFVNESKIGFVGVKITKGVSMHGLCLNVNNDTSMFNSIIPCGIQGVQITSIQKILHNSIQINQVKDMFIKTIPF
ncbi:MAG: lipoyl(octanoyl) transferase LipB [Alphaproteobacteria bacterium]|nr:lipoyl(octanoyl) transferase LipB [Alphaproteobacteria bacterium]